MYSAIASNKRKSWALIGVSILLIGGVGYLLDQYFEAGGSIVVIALVYAGISALITFYSGDKLALWTAGAKEIQKNDAPELYRLVENLCIADGLPTPKVYVIEDPAPNAFATGRDPQHASIAFTRGILERLDKTELEGVTAHELSHVKNFDVRLMTMVAVLAGTVTLMVDIFFRVRWRGGGGRDRRGDGAVVLILFLLAMVFALIAANLIKLAISRKREYLADASGALLTRYPEGLARALEKISSDPRPLARATSATAHLYISNPLGPNGFLTGLFSTHPPIADRIKLLRDMEINPNG